VSKANRMVGGFDNQSKILVLCSANALKRYPRGSAYLDDTNVGQARAMNASVGKSPSIIDFYTTKPE